MPLGLLSFCKKIIYKNLNVRAFVVARLTSQQIKQTAVLESRRFKIDITGQHSIICLDPFCIAVWMEPKHLNSFHSANATIIFKKGNKTRSRLHVSLIEETNENNTILLLYEVKKVECFQLNPLSRFLTLFFFLKNKTSTYRERKFIAALYSYPRKIIAVSYKEDNYCNIFPMDIQGHVAESNLIVLGLRTTNITLNKILETKKLVVADTCNADIKTIYSLGRHLSTSPPKIEEFPFKTIDSELFNFPVPAFSSSYKEVEIIRNRKMGYHMLLVGRILNFKQTESDPASLYHIHLLEFLHSDYAELSNAIY